MLDTRIRLKQPWLSGLLAFLLPGAGHAYQGRYFKAVLYFICILGIFFSGMAMAEWQAVQPPAKGVTKGTTVLKYVAQCGVGLPALFGLVQRERLASPQNDRVTSIPSAFSAPCEGMVSYLDENGNQSGMVRGTLTLRPSAGEFGKSSITGEFIGKMDEKEVTFQLADHVELAPPVDASKERPFVAGLINKRNGRNEETGQMRGTIPRSFWNWFEVPVNAQQEEDLHRRLGKFHELAMVFTWIAGLLNVLAIWDAVEGPAYGYGDENFTEPDPAAGKS